MCATRTALWATTSPHRPSKHASYATAIVLHAI
jgi:hypothetical protein